VTLPMTAPDVTGVWRHENAVPLGGGVLRIASSWSFDPDGRAALEIHAVVEHDGRVVVQNAASHVGRWLIRENTLVVDLLDHTDSPFELTMTPAGELTSDRRATWRRGERAVPAADPPQRT